MSTGGQTCWRGNYTTSFRLAPHILCTYLDPLRSRPTTMETGPTIVRSTSCIDEKCNCKDSLLTGNLLHFGEVLVFSENHNQMPTE